MSEETYNAQMEKYRAQLIDNINHSQDSYDKTIIHLSAATIGASLLLLSDITSPTEAIGQCFLILSWVCSLISIALVVYSFQIAVSEAVTRYTDSLNDDEDNDGENDNNDSQNILINRVAGISFAFSLIFLLIFAFMNITMSEESNARSKEEPDTKHSIPAEQEIRNSWQNNCDGETQENNHHKQEQVVINIHNHGETIMNESKEKPSTKKVFVTDGRITASTVKKPVKQPQNNPKSGNK